jgi:hypothetical protein
MTLDARQDSWHLVELLWDEVQDRTFVRVESDSEVFELEVPKVLALDAFNHPYAYRTEYATYSARASA